MSERATALAADRAAREHALDVTRSWLVQAPAGSGKTGLLIQRYLALLARVDAPERILAMTFTRKAAAEMQERVLQALDQAADPHAKASSEHDARTLELARAALAQDRRHGWRVADHPARLRIVTIDAFTTALARAAPLSTGLGALPGFVDDATALYRAAARAALAQAPADDQSWRTFLQWIDNDAHAAVNLLAEMLAARDRWEGLLQRPPAAMRAEVEQALAAEACAALQALRALLPSAMTRELIAHARHALAFLAEEAADTPRVAMLRALSECGDVPPAAVGALADWRALVDWLMTQQGAFTRAVTREHGFPAKGNGPGMNERAARKDAFVRWLEAARAVPGLETALHRVRDIPPERFGDEAWAFVCATLAILPQAAAQLLTVMAAHGQADFAEAMLRALQALGTADRPEELLLALDARIDHLLVDEFQDTSTAQLELVRRITAGWQPGDGRTLFAVGDPMQSIYRFREAEVRIFVEAQAARRVGDVPVGTLELARNFRSRAAIVEWVNEVFAQVLPPVSNAARSEVAYRASHPHDARDEPLPTLELHADRRAEADAVVQHIAAARADGLRSIAVLVRARTHVESIVRALREAGIPYHAVEIEPLEERLATRDLVWLARALSQPADRLAWLAVLRAPWCGLTLTDLLALVGSRDEGAILGALHDDAALARLSADGAARARRLRRAIEPALAARGRAPFSLRVRAAWLALGGPLCVDSALDRDGADRLFALLDAQERAGDLADFDAFHAATRRLYAVSPAASSEGVQIMTLHKAKGLEFDAVILPGLDRVTQSGEARPLRWKVRETQGHRTLVLAPLTARIGAEAQADPVYAWLGVLDAAEEAAELGRLLYVGATRARHRLHLTAVGSIVEESAGPRWKPPARTSALARLWRAVHERVAPPAPASAGAAPGARQAARPPPSADQQSASATRSAEVAGGTGLLDFTDEDARDEDPAPPTPLLRRLPPDWPGPHLPALLPSSTAAQPATREEQPAFDWAQATAAAVGTVAHRLLAQLSREPLSAWDESRLARERPRIVSDLALAGVPAAERARAAERVVQAVLRTLADPQGRWLFATGHTEHAAEWPLAGVDDGEIVHVALDRTFVADGVRWIVDFKTGSHEGGDASAFLDREVERYRPQLMRYARLVRALDARPIRLALYYPLVDGGLRAFDFDG